MHTCPLLRATPRPHKAAHARRTPPARVSAGGRRGPLLAASLAGWLGWMGWRGLQDVLNAIPDSNDDFGLF
ncbi:hypothetical protein A6V36_14210 [Paraburkholderia ginsengiterrae]|uniref:Uncharacterized protein n=1 Tax=Paraburkholderia ginsengiterrae TaxID=1462993 RepID=A0A1A9N5S9_9BURK|nr:hypothetical protein [Paraburkholderia ginsengiterrae]OAJ52554.1 hypothetical protein A6V36_14210 [Paraburkholderia ginsengiterrae]OAJ59140.1 hypothetical protein A6V37_27850 [Paraburkholderia ginsengiterrae]